MKTENIKLGKFEKKLKKRVINAVTRDLFNVSDEKREERAQIAIDRHTERYNEYVVQNEPKAWIKNEVKKYEAEVAAAEKREEIEAELTIS